MKMKKIGFVLGLVILGLIWSDMSSSYALSYNPETDDLLEEINRLIGIFNDPAIDIYTRRAARDALRDIALDPETDLTTLEYIVTTLNEFLMSHESPEYDEMFVVRTEVSEYIMAVIGRLEPDSAAFQSIVDVFSYILLNRREHGDIRDRMMWYLADISELGISTDTAKKIIEVLFDVAINNDDSEQVWTFEYLREAFQNTKDILPFDFWGEVILQSLVDAVTTGYISPGPAWKLERTNSYAEILGTIVAFSATPEAKAIVAEGFGLEGTQLDIWNNFGVLVVNEFTDRSMEPEFQIIQKVLSSLTPEALEYLRFIALLDINERAGGASWGNAGGFYFNFRFGDFKYDPIYDDIYEYIDNFTSSLFHEIGHLIYENIFNSELQKKFAAFYEESTDKVNDFADPFGKNNASEDFATIFEAWCANSWRLLEKALGQERNLLFNKILLVINYFIFKETDGLEYVYMYRQDLQGNIDRGPHLIKRNENGDIIGIDINGDGKFGEDEMFGDRLDLPTPEIPENDTANRLPGLKRDSDKDKIDYYNLEVGQEAGLPGIL
jgi:hypothetical protein